MPKSKRLLALRKQADVMQKAKKLKLEIAPKLQLSVREEEITLTESTKKILSVAKTH